MKSLVCIVAGLMLAGCGPDWGDCKDCRAGEPSAEDSTGQQIPVDNDVTVVVNVDVDVDVDVPTEAPPACTQCSLPPPPVVCDAGTPPPPPKPDAGCKTRKVCTSYKKFYKCSNGKSYNQKPKLPCKYRCTEAKKCVKEETKCC